MPRDLDVHLIVDNYSTHKHDKVKKMAGTATSISHSLHAHLCFMAQFAKLKSGSNAKWNANAHPFMWTATANSILAKGKRLCEYISAT